MRETCTKTAQAEVDKLVRLGQLKRRINSMQRNSLSAVAETAVSLDLLDDQSLIMDASHLEGATIFEP